ncbi:hypothetical protein F2Q68_00044613 [Brassica cretica]|uniref:Uncharacterized protein n=1 Tax=Brassica cretica TaxID=69181 RepID=A0A8S9LQI3_BRACR|nr:hypothetical protein F2Q68_00044613 [Brassica cretica]
MGCWTTRGYVAPGDIPLIRSLVTSSTHRRGTFCWNYAMNGQYTVRYWVAWNLLKTEEDMKVLEFGITKLQSFAWKVTSPQKICHLMLGSWVDEMDGRWVDLIGKDETGWEDGEDGRLASPFYPN